MCDIVVATYPFVFLSVPDQCNQQMWNKGVDNFLPTLKFVPNWFVTNKMI